MGRRILLSVIFFSISIMAGLGQAFGAVGAHGGLDRGVMVALNANQDQPSGQTPPAPSSGSGLEGMPELNSRLIELFQSGRYQEAVPVAEELLALADRNLPPRSGEKSMIMAVLAELYKATGKLPQAAELYLQAIDIQREVYGVESREVAAGLNNLGLVYDRMGRFREAEPLLRQALAIREKVLGPQHPEVAGSQNNLAALLVGLGEYGQAEDLYLKALAVLEKAQGPDDGDVGTTLNNLAYLHKQTGDYAQAEDNYRRALKIKETAWGPEHPEVGIALDNLGVLLTELGSLDQAEPLLVRALGIFEKALGPEDLETATTLNNLGELHRGRGDYKRAEPYFQRALAIREKVLGRDSGEAAQILENLGALYHEWGDYERAEPAYLRAGELLEKAYGRDHPDFAIQLNNLAGLYRDMGRSDKSADLYVRSHDIWLESLGPVNTQLAVSLDNQATVKVDQGQYWEAFKLLGRSQEIQGRLTAQVMGLGSEKRKMDFIATQRKSLSAFLTLVLNHLADRQEAVRKALDIWLQRKGVVLEAQRRFQEALVYADSPEAHQTFRDLAEVRARLSKIMFLGTAAGDREESLALLAGLEERKNELEARLVELSRAWAADQRKAKADSRQVAGRLPEGAVLVEFVRLDIFNFKAKGRENRWLPPRYVAFVLGGGAGRPIGLRDLGEAEVIDKAVSVFKRALFEKRNPREIDGIGRRVHDLVFAPLGPDLGQARQVYISPDGNLSLIPFEVLSPGEGRYLIDDYTFYYLSSGRDLLGFEPAGESEVGPGPGRLLILGDPDYDRSEKGSNGTSPDSGRTLKTASGELKRAPDLRGWSFTPLPGTRDEVIGISKLWPSSEVEVHLGQEASEERLFQAEVPEVLHIATHGFFLKSPREATFPGREGGSGRPGDQAAGSGRVESAVFNPLLRSGLALAGANSSLGAGDELGSRGLLTAEKVLDLKLRGTELVVLSACETGLGEVAEGEGVMGLQRSFMQAGARSLVMSMWSVPDRETQELMVEFYRQLLSGNQDRAQALRVAALREKDLVKERYGHSNPAWWGAFVFMGRP
jgi:CHAT domain-containing protein/Tfp pilus assembly protein PilF